MIQEHEMERDVKTMSKSMLIVMIFTMVSKVTGYLREILLASQYGRTLYADAYTYAQDLPCIILSVIVAAVSATLIPVFSGQLKQGQEKANRFVSNLFTIGLLLSLVIVLLTTAFLDQFAALYMPDADAEVRKLVIELARIMMPMGLFVFLARISSAYLQANFRFTAPALSACCLNFVIIGSILLSRGENITYVAIGTLLGWILQFAVQVPSMCRTGLRYRPVVDFREPGLREVIILMLPVLISSAFDQVYLFFDRSIVSGVTGDVTALSYGNRISTMVSSVLLTTIATILYPNLVRHVDEKNKFRDDLSFGINLNLLIAIPATFALVLLCRPVTQLVYQRGKFGAEDTLVTAGTLACYACGILGVGMRELCNRCFYAYKDTKVPTAVGILAVLMNIALNYILYPLLGVAGVSLATAISSLTSGALLLTLLHRRRKVLDGPRVLRCLWKTTAASGVMTAVLLVLSYCLRLSTLQGSPFYLAMIVLFVCGVGAYVLTLALLKTEELRMALRMVLGKLGRK